MPYHIYADALDQLDLETLQNRRENLSTKFFQNNLGNAHFQDYPPEKNVTNYMLIKDVIIYINIIVVTLNDSRTTSFHKEFLKQ